MLKFPCENCGTWVRVREERQGERAICRNCNTRQPVPEDARAVVQQPVEPVMETTYAAPGDAKASNTGMQWMKLNLGHYTLATMADRAFEFSALFIVFLIVGKVVEVSAEPVGLKARALRLDNDQWAFVYDIGFGLVRRVDDAKFWVFVAYLLGYLRLRSIGMMVHALDRVSLPNLARRRRRNLVIAAVVIWLLGTLWYLHSIVNFGGTFLWDKRIDPTIQPEFQWTLFSIRLVYPIQWIEGAGNVLFWGAIAIFFVYAIRLVSEFSQHPKNRKQFRTIAGALLTPLIGSFIYFTIVSIVLKWTTDQHELSSTHPVRALGQAVLYSVPFLIALGWLIWTNPLLRYDTNWLDVVGVASKGKDDED
jgi:hypothetical protein